MKAIEILNKLIKAEHWEDYYPSKNDCNDAIKELEVLKNRSCDTCKYGHPYSDEYIECSNSKTDTEGLEFEKDFYCKNWQSKR